MRYVRSISNRRPRSSRNANSRGANPRREHIESETALKPEHDCDFNTARVRAYRIGDRAQAGTVCLRARCRKVSISNRRPRSSRNSSSGDMRGVLEHIESETALKPEQLSIKLILLLRAYRIGDRAQAGTTTISTNSCTASISNRRPRSSRNRIACDAPWTLEHIESETALKPERKRDRRGTGRGAYRIGDRAQAGTK